VGDPVILIFTNGARGFLALPKPLFGSECDDNNAAGMYCCSTVRKKTNHA